MSGKNYEVTFSQFGGYPRGKVLPLWVIARACNPKSVKDDIAHLVERGVLRETAQPVNVTLSVPEPKSSGDPTADLVRENNQLRGELKAATEAGASHRELAELHKATLDGREKALAELTDKAAYWQRRAEEAESLIESKYAVEIKALGEQLAERDEEIAVLKADLEQATAPKPKRTRELAAV